MFFGENEKNSDMGICCHIFSNQWPLEQESKKGGYKKDSGVSAEAFKKSCYFKLSSDLNIPGSE
jgi:hypothetical protein